MKLIFKDVVKRYGNLNVLERVNFVFESGPPCCLMGPSGTGKTTLLRLALGLESPDGGLIMRIGGERFTAVFQEDRLCESFTPVENVAMVMDRRVLKTAVEAELLRLLPGECLRRPVATLSGGMKRRVAIFRALLAPSDGIVMDEPFTGLDENTKKKTIYYIKEKTAGKLLLLSTHQREDVELLEGLPFNLVNS